MLSHARLVEGLTHEDVFVRSPILDHLSYIDGGDIAATRAAMAAIDRFGWGQTFATEYLLADLAQDEDSLAWIASALDGPADQPPNLETRARLLYAFSQASPALLRPHLARLEQAAQDPRFTTLPSASMRHSPLEQAKYRMRLASLDALACRALLERQLKAMAKGRHDDPSRRLLWICERLAELQVPSEEEIVRWVNPALLEREPVGVGHWRAWVGMRLAGTLRIERLVPDLLACMALPWELWNQAIATALSRIGTLSMLDHVVEAYPKQAWHGRLYLTGVLEKVRFPGMESTLRFLLEREESEELRVALAQALSLYATPEAIKVAKAVYRDKPSDPERITISKDLYALMTLDGIEDPDLAEWRRGFEEERQWVLARQASPGRLPAAAARGVGRNEPCPCGSGKKFKKCCLGKT